MRTRIRGSRTSWVDSFWSEGKRWFLKTYVYPPPFGPLRGAFRNTFAAPSRAQREWRALKHLWENNLQPDLAAALEERRRLGWLLESQLLTADFGGPDLAAEIRQHRISADAHETWTAIGKFVRRLHETGLRDPDLKARNLLIRRRDGALEIAKIDASSSRIVRGGPRWDRRRVHDVVVLLDDLAQLGVDIEARHLVLEATLGRDAVPRLDELRNGLRDAASRARR